MMKGCSIKHQVAQLNSKSATKTMKTKTIKRYKRTNNWINKTTTATIKHYLTVGSATKINENQSAL